MLKENERLDCLIKENLEIIQNDEVFSFSTDALLLAHLTPLRTKDKVMDICSGNGIIPLLLSDRTDMPIDCIEIQPQLVDMAQRSFIHNQLNTQLNMYEMDIKDVKGRFTPSQYDIVTCNPPYFRQNQSFQHLKEAHRIARHEVLCDFSDCVRAANHLLKQGGKMIVVQRADRLIDVLTEMRMVKIEPKLIYPIYATPNKAQAITVVVHGIKGGKADVKMMPPFYIYNDKNEYSEEMNEVYYG